MKRVPELDALRGLAALFVAMFHLNLTSTPIFQIGWSGVDVFFLLSGYLITTIILKNGDKPGFLLNFYMRRSLRIWPIYYLTLIFLAIMHSLFMKNARLDGLWLYLLYLQNVPLYWNSAMPPLDMHMFHTWTLAVEEQFYLIWPFLLTYFGRRGLIPISLVTIAVALAMRSVGYPNILLLTRCDSLALGSLLSLVFIDPQWSERNASRIRGLFGLGLVVSLSVAAGEWYISGVCPFVEPLRYPAHQLFNIEIIFLCMLGVILTLVGKPILAPLRMRWLVGLGTISYGFYLYHTIIFVFSVSIFLRLGWPEPWWFNIMRLSLAILAATLSWFLVEKPILRLKDRFKYDPAPKGQTLPELTTTTA